MQFIKSLLCWQGFDNRKRFMVINISSVIAFIILNQALSEHNLSATIVLLICSGICLASTRRRVNDAQLDKNWLLAPAGSFLIAGLIIIFIGNTISYGLLIVALIVSFLLLTYPSKNHRQFILGYSGPVDLSEFKRTEKVSSRNNSRVEPTINTINIAHAPINKNHHASSTDSIDTTENSSSTRPTNQSDNNVRHKADIGETIRLALFSRKNIRITFTMAGILLVLILVVSLRLSSPPSKHSTPAQQSVINEPSNSFQHKITLPDNFSLMISNDNGIVIQWQANVTNNSEVWALATAMGDKSCENVAFEKGATIRTYRVSIVDGEYYAYFSPLDSKALINNIALKNKFALCSYSFSLKGSQATLGKSSFYADLIEY